MKIKQRLRPVKDPLGQSMPGVYLIPCECGPSYGGQTSRTVKIRCTEHQRHVRLDRVDKSAIVQHFWQWGH